MTNNAVSPSPAGHQSRFGDLLVCGICGDIKGPVPELPDGCDQCCECVPLEDRRARPRWGRYDFNCAFELCRCCGLEALKSGSRWSVWFCHPCKERVRSLNQLTGRCVIPIGRHSLMNGVSASTEAGQAAFDASAETLATFVAQTIDIGDWGRRVVLDNLAALGIQPDRDVLLSQYLDEARRSDLHPEAAFRKLLQLVAAPSESE